ncbi:hypothetical protein BV25DRAFT_986335 [Artomyces pyxidatus]|uniref:Uncharacterized protein n=1 Tax=Artomyces pyxidatus TaxID=48021 RepID=A0ACB8SUH4_9AGAM|nr:hypothetical protein BV25DRAFT_986335 [Artomyces pyxidatus]
MKSILTSRIVGPLCLLVTVASGTQVTFAAQEVAWDAPPHPDSTDHLLFSAVSSLLQRWPNVLYGNGHTIVPAMIPIGTSLYHGGASSAPIAPDWAAFDFDHAYMFCRRGPCHVVSLITTRDLRLAYFDGSSAVKLGNGSMDSQDVVAWGKPSPERCFDEWDRIEDLCAWGRPLGIDGFLRVGYHFEVMLCDFSAGLEVIEVLNYLPKIAPERDDVQKFWDSTVISSGAAVVSPQLDPPDGWKGSLPDELMSAFQGLVTGSWHDRAPGETRVHIDYSGLVTFYDTELSSLVAPRRKVPRKQYRLLDISANDSARVHAELAEVLGRKTKGSGVDWGSITRVVVERYAERLATLRYLLDPSGFSDAAEQAAIVRTQLLTMLVPYITAEAVPENFNASWASSVAGRCARTATSRLPAGLLTLQERRIQRSVQGTLHEICRRLTLMWVDAFDIEAADETHARNILEVWQVQVSELMEWLGWSVWSRCNPACEPDAMCYLSTWPPFVFDPSRKHAGPHCISLVKPGEWA